MKAENLQLQKQSLCSERFLSRSLPVWLRIEVLLLSDIVVVVVGGAMTSLKTYNSAQQ